VPIIGSELEDAHSDVSASFVLEEIKETTELPLNMPVLGTSSRWTCWAMDKSNL